MLQKHDFVAKNKVPHKNKKKCFSVVLIMKKKPLKIQMLDNRHVWHWNKIDHGCTNWAMNYHGGI